MTIELLVGVVASLVGAIVFVIVSAVFSRHARSVLFSLCVRMLRMDMEAVFLNKQMASADIEGEFRRARVIFILTGRGNEFQRGVLAQTLGGLGVSRVQTLRIVLPLTDVKHSSRHPDWVSVRESELSQFDFAYSGGLLKNQIRATIRYLEKPVREQRAELRLASYPLIGRIVLTDSVAYVNPYSDLAHGRDCPVIKFRRGGAMYELCFRIFTVVWNQASAPWAA